jgi:hypothetical protein
MLRDSLTDMARGFADAIVKAVVEVPMGELREETPKRYLFQLAVAPSKATAGRAGGLAAARVRKRSSATPLNDSSKRIAKQVDVTATAVDKAEVGAKILSAIPAFPTFSRTDRIAGKVGLTSSELAKRLAAAVDAGVVLRKRVGHGKRVRFGYARAK